jgi:phage gpG-like protein
MADGVRIELDTTGLDRAIARLSDRVQHMRDAWDSAGRYLRSQVQLGFRRQQSPYGQPWKPTRRGGQILRLTSRMRDSVDYEAGGDSLAIGTNVEYAPSHQFGATIEAKNVPFLKFKIGDRWVNKKSVEIPARPFLPTDGLPDDWQAGVLRVLGEHFGRA